MGRQILQSQARRRRPGPAAALRRAHRVPTGPDPGRGHAARRPRGSARRHRRGHRLRRLHPARAHPGLAGRARRQSPVLPRQVRGDGRPVRRGHGRAMPQAQDGRATAAIGALMVRRGRLHAPAQRMAAWATRPTPCPTSPGSRPICACRPRSNGSTPRAAAPRSAKRSFASGSSRRRVRSATMPGTRGRSPRAAGSISPACSRPTRSASSTCSATSRSSCSSRST